MNETSGAGALGSERSVAALRGDSRRSLPRPTVPEDIILTRPNGSLTARQIFELMRDEDARSWRADLADWSPTCMVLSRAWVFKGNLMNRRSDFAKVARRLETVMRDADRLSIWHPAKTWFLLRDRTRYLPCSATPRLRVLHELGSLERIRLRPQQGWLFARALLYGRVIDPHSRNFGRGRDRERLYYVDDEIYRPGAFLGFSSPR